ncbi:hypothetical protein [Clostridium sp.]|uniref:hypothetical protein n=1 Tax=Clostridium sp. TaxID=1506 RepID=UPI003F35C589
MEVHIKLKEKKDPVVYTAERIDVLDFEMNSIKYKQIRYFKKGFSKSELIVADLIEKITTKN